MAGQQRRLAHASKRDSDSVKTLSLLGAVFLPATFISSVFSMTFFNFQPEGDPPPIISPLLWVYFVITVPVTLVIVMAWRWWDRRRETKYAAEDKDLEAGIEVMEAQIMSNMRKRTLSKIRTWDLGKTE
jgi:hypothetical protein